MLYQTRPKVLTPGQGVDTLLQAEKDVKTLEEELAKAKAYKRELETAVLPDVFGAAEQKEATSTSGAKAKFGLLITGSLPKVDEDASEEEQALQAQAREEAIKLADSYGWGPLIKSTVTAAYDKGDREKALELYQKLRGDNSVILKIDESIHAMTLASQVRKRIQEGKAVNSAALGLTVMTAVTLTKRPKA